MMSLTLSQKNTVFVAAILSVAAISPTAQTEVRFVKTVLDTTFRAEGVAIADVNRDGKPDILAGEVWYEAPDWKMHELQPPGVYDPAKGYSSTFSNYAFDVNGDGWIDSITTTMMGQPCHWFENPKNKPGHWKKRVGTKSACNETPLFGVQPDGYIAWFGFTDNPESEWDMHKIAGPGAPGSKRFSHGLGVGDVNGDGRNDVLVPEGWWEAPEDRTKQNWEFHPAKLGPACADMLVYDVDNDGDNDIITSSAHNYGIWWFEQIVDGSGRRFEQHLITKSFSQVHALRLADINNDGVKDFVAGKRYFAHNGKDPGAMEPAVVYWFQIRRPKDGQPEFIPHLIDDDSGLGTQFDTADLNGDGKIDIAGANKKGVFVFTQK